MTNQFMLQDYMMTILLNGTFQITGWNETIYAEGVDGAKQTNAKITQTYQGDIEGTSELQYLMAYTSSNSAIFVGLETLSGCIKGKSGTFVIKHDGKFEAGVASSQFIIVSNSGKGELVGISGQGSLKSENNGQAAYIVEIT